MDYNRRKRILICIAIIVVMIVVANPMSLKTLFAQPITIGDNAAELEDFMSNLPNIYAEITDGYVINSGWVIDTTDDSKNTTKSEPVYFGKIGDKYYLALYDVDADEAPGDIEKDKLLIETEQASDIENFDEVREGIAKDANEYLELNITKDDIIDGVVRIQDDRSSGRYVVMLCMTIIVVCAVVVIVTIRNYKKECRYTEQKELL